MFLVIPLVEFLHVLGVDINVHHENPATFLCHVRLLCEAQPPSFCLVSLAPGPHAWSPGETRDTNWEAILADVSQIPGLLRRDLPPVRRRRNRWFVDSLLEGDGFELSVPGRKRVRPFRL